MLKLACRIFDIYDDTDCTIAATLAAELGQCKVAGRDEIEKLPDSAFGLVMKTAGGALRRRYPLHDEDSRKLSAAFFERVRADLPSDVAEVIAAKIAHPEGPVAYVDATTLQPAREKVAFAEHHWGLTVDGVNYFPLHNAELVKIAVNRFMESAGELYPEERCIYAREIAKRAEQLEVAIPTDSMIASYVGDELNAEALKHALELRRPILKNAGVDVGILDQLAESCGCPLTRDEAETNETYAWRSRKCAAARGRADVAHVIGVLQNLDKLAGITNQEYMRGLPDPFAAVLSVHSLSEKLATVTDGVDLAKIPAEKLAEQFGDSFVAEFQRNPAVVYNSLPAPVKIAIKAMANTKSHDSLAAFKAHRSRLPATASGAGGAETRLGATYANGAPG